MGVPGLWDLLRPAAARTSLSTLARDAFHANRNGLRAFTVGIDASIWIFHAQIPVHGENPFVRTIFYKIATLLQHPVLPVFVFDGPNKPGRKRNERVAGQFGTYDWRSRRFKELLDVCGLEWWNAPGEAEAELAVMNRQGKIDAVLSDDVDALLFGATCLLRNNSPTLSGAQASSTQTNSSRGDARHYEVYRSSAVLHEWASKEGTSLATEEDCRRAMVLVALLSGGDYAPEGLTQFGATISFALANAGLADFLKLYQTDPSAFAADLSSTHGKMVDELRTNSTGHLGRRYPDRAGKLASRDPSSLFPAFALDAYLQPCTSPADDPSRGWPGFGKGESSSGRGKSRNEGRGDLEGMAKACEKYFEWGTKEIVGKKFASEGVGIFGGQVVNEAREAVRRMKTVPVLDRDSVPVTGSGSSESASGPSRITSFFQQSTSTVASKTTTMPLEPGKTPAHILRIHSVRKDPTATDLNEYRISYQHEGYLSRCHGAMAGTRCDPSELPVEEREALGLVDRGEDNAGVTASQAPVSGAAKSELRVWVAEYLVREAWPELVAAYEEELRAKADRLKSPRKRTTGARNVVRGKTRRAAGGSRAAEDTDRFKSFFTQKPGPGARASRSPSPEEAVEELEDRPPRFSSTIPTSPRRSASGKSSSPAPLKQGKTPRARPRPSSSPPSSILSQTLSVPPDRELVVSPSPIPVIRRTRPRRKSARVISSSPGPSLAEDTALPTSGTTPAPRRTTTTSSAAPRARDTAPGPSKSNAAQNPKGKKDEPIDLCSTDDEARPPAPRRSPRNADRSSSTLGKTASTTSSVLAGSSRANEQISSSPPHNRHTGTKKNTTKTKATSKNGTAAKQVDDVQTGTLQTLLALPVVSRGTAVASSPAIKESQVGKLGKPGKTKKKGRVSYVVTYENSDWEEIDSTRGR